MLKPIPILVLAALLGLLICDLASAHGTRYRPPKDWVPPNPGGPDGDSGPGAGGSGPQTPGNGGPATVGPRGPSSPSGPSGPSGNRGAGTGGLGRKRRNSDLGLERWEFWWEKNKDPYLNLKDRLDGPSNISGSSGFLTGRGRKDKFLFSRRPTPEMIGNEVLPVLRKALQEDNPDIQDSSVLAIARIIEAENAAPSIDSIKALLSSRFASARESACLSLGVLGSPIAAQTCYELMIDSPKGQTLVGLSEVPRTVRAFAALSLGLIGSGESWERLKMVVEHENEKDQKDLIACAITPLGLMDHTSRKDEIVAFLMGKLEDRRMDPLLRSYIPVALGKLGDPMALNSVMKEFRKTKQENLVRQSCAIAIGLLADFGKDREPMKLLRQYINDGKDVQTRHFAFMALADIGARDTSFAANLDRQIKLSNFFLKEMTRPKRTSHRSWAALAAAVHCRVHPILQATVIAKLEENFREIKNPSDKAAMAIALGLLGAESSASMLVEELGNTRDKTLQGYLCVSLGMMDWKKAAKRIRDIARNAIEIRLRLQAATALGLMGDTEAVPMLTDVLETGQTHNVTLSAAKALGQIGDRRAIPSLRKILENRNASGFSRAFAAVALGVICEKTPLPWNSEIKKDCNYYAAVAALAEATDIL